MQQKVSHGHIYHLNNGFMFETGWTEFKKYSVFWNDGLSTDGISFTVMISSLQKKKNLEHTQVREHH